MIYAAQDRAEQRAETSLQYERARTDSHLGDLRGNHSNILDISRMYVLCVSLRV